ncbi:MAG: GNAT family N-acetyltransferase [Solirubrobacterales bacterium]|nr:GNAT family N-acetyltransferase [Solirubrobacterales bacterium]
MPALPDLPAPLAGDRASLRYAAERDIPEILIAHQDDPRLFVALGLERPPSGAQLGRRAEAVAGDRASGTSAWLTITEPGADLCVGQVDVYELDWEQLHAEVCIWVAPRHRDRGIAADALALVGRWLIESCRIMRVQLLADPGHAALRRAAQRAGYVTEGVLRGYLRRRGDRVDVTVLSLVAADLAVVR